MSYKGRVRLSVFRNKNRSKRKQQYHHSTVCRIQELFVVFADMGHRSKVMVKPIKRKRFSSPRQQQELRLQTIPTFL